MNPGKSSSPGDSNEEILALIATLRATDQRLEELTAGEVDSVADRDGRTFLLQRAREVYRIAGLAADITERKLAEEVIKRRSAELERFHRLSVGRELQTIELKKQINVLAVQAGQKPPYDLAFLGPQAAKTGPGHEQTS